MASSGLFGPHALDTATVDRAVKGYGPGAYALGYTLQNGKFRITYVGRADHDLNDRVKDHVGERAEFKYAFYDTAEDAFYKECELYHVFDPVDNLIHPDSPDGTNLKCPHCQQMR